jgi:hypothetical protein
MCARRLTSARRSKRTGAALCLLLLTLLGCERKAPGPDECQRFAETAVGMARDDQRVTLRIQAEIDEETQTCLTRPYDRALIACVESTRRARPCLELYKRRTGQIR